MTDDLSSPGRWPARPTITTGLRCRCPRCATGPLYTGLLSVRDNCTHCGLDLTNHDTGDGASIFVIFILGILLVPIALSLDFLTTLPIWGHLLIWPPVILGMAIVLLRPVKGILIALHFRNLRHKYDD